MRWRAFLLPPSHKEYAELRRDPDGWFSRQMEHESSSDAVPDSIAVPEEMADYIAWRETKWDYWTQKSQPSNWLTKILMAHAEDTRIQSELYDERYRVADAGSKPAQEPLNEAELAEIRASNPRFEQLPDDALRKLYGKRRR